MRRLLPLFIVLLLFSCASEEFTVSSLSFSQSGDDAVLHASFSDPDMSYTFRLVSPDGDLSWEGSFRGEEEDKISENLELTPGASFPEGEYSIIIYSDKGSEVEDTVSFRY